MPRRKGGKAKGGSSKSKRVNKKDASMTKWNTADDIPLDEADQFHANRDKILLEGGDDDYVDGEEDDEVFALKGMDDDEDDEDDGGAYDDDEDEEMEDIPAPPKAKSKSKKKGKEAAPDSDEEKDSEPEEESWGRGKAAYYNSNTDELESDDDEGHELEEQEAKRLQAKAREHMTDEDFGLKDVIEIEKDDADILAEPTPQVVAPMPTEPADIIRHLEKTNPEALALARDWEDTAEQLLYTERKIKEVEAEDPNGMSLGMLHLHYQTLLAYTSVLAFYIHLRATPKYAQHPNLLQNHPIMKRLLTLKQALQTMEELDFNASDDEDDEDDDLDDEFDLASQFNDPGMSMEDILKDRETLWDRVKKAGLEENELDDLLQDADLDNMEVEKPRKSKSKEKKSSKEPPKKKRKVQKEEAEPVFDLVEPEFVSSKKPSSRLFLEDDSFGEAQYLQQTDAADKAARKKSLQFHTSRIESASARRNAARSKAIGGDDDIPYRERAKEKAARLDKEAKAKMAKQGGEDLDDTEPPLPSGKRRLEEDSDGSDGGDSPDEYYELVKKKSKEKKEKKKAEHDAEREATKVIVEDDASGPRSLTRAILKNRGLTPHRAKAVRNPRVKKRQKYDQAKKKLASQKAVYKGGVAETKGRYEGERSGISKVVKSVSLG